VGGDGGALKDPQSEYRPGEATEAWLKVKARAAVTWAQRM
jgi:ATP-dependent DNA ligase